MNHTDTEQNLAHAKRLTEADRVSINFYDGWLPDKIIDAHAHSGEISTSHNAQIRKKDFEHMSSTYLHFPISYSREFDAIFHPRKEITRIRFAKVQRGLSQRATNQYLLSNYSKNDQMAAFGLKEDIAGTISTLKDQRCCALKMYYRYCHPTATTIRDTFSDEILEFCQEIGKPIILHLPKPLLQSIDDLRSVMRSFPKLKVSLAHLGLHMIDSEELSGAFEEIKGFETVNLDSALNISPEVFCRALKILGPNRIMFGTDEPINLLRFNVYIHSEKGERIVSDRVYHWTDKADHKIYSKDFNDYRHSHWLALDAARTAIEQSTQGKRITYVKESIFFENAKQFFGLQI